MFFRGFATSAFAGQALECSTAADTPQEASALTAVPVPAGAPKKPAKDSAGTQDPVVSESGEHAEAAIDTGTIVDTGAPIGNARDDSAADLSGELADGTAVEKTVEAPVEAPVELSTDGGCSFKAMPADDFAGGFAPEFAGDLMDEPPAWEDGYLESLAGLEADREPVRRKESGPSAVSAKTQAAEPVQPAQSPQSPQAAVRPRSLFDVRG